MATRLQELLKAKNDSLYKRENLASIAIKQLISVPALVAQNNLRT